MKTILVHIDSDDGLEARLQAAFDLARAFGGHLTCLQVTPYAAYGFGDAATGAYPITALVEAIEFERRAERDRVEVRLQAEGVSWDWCARDGDTVDRLVEAARLVDVVVMSAGPFGKLSGNRLSLTGDVAIHAPAPVLAVPPNSRGVAVTGAAVIAWDGSQEAALAVRAALPLLRLAESVDVLTIAEKATEFRGRDVATYLARQGIPTEVIERDSGGEPIETGIRNVLAERRAAFLVQGAYGHSRLRETLFGGVTRGLLAFAPVPLLMAH